MLIPFHDKPTIESIICISFPTIKILGKFIVGSVQQHGCDECGQKTTNE
jgi:hypothetical protein